MKNFSRKYFLIIILHLISNNIYADAFHFFESQLKIQFNSGQIKISEIDSIYLKVFTRERENIITTGFDTNERRKHLLYHDKGILVCSGYEYNEFEVFILTNGKWIKSKRLNFYSTRDIYKLKLNKSELVDISDFFYTPIENYFYSLKTTLIIEVLMLYFLILYFGHSFWLLPAFILVNLISHPLLWIVCTRFGIPLIPLELLVIVLEYFLLYLMISKFITKKRIAVYVTIFNATSMILGGILYMSHVK